MKASLITNKSNIAYLSGFTGSSGFMLLVGTKSYLFTDSRYIERAKKTLPPKTTLVDTTKMWKTAEELKKNWQGILKKHRITILGIEENNLTISQFKRYQKISGKLKYSDISGQIEAKREIKTTKEIKIIENSQAINEKVFLAIQKIIKNSFPTEKELAWKIKELGNQFGAEDVSFDPIVAFNENSAIPHHEPSSRKLKKGDIVLVDMGMKYQGYCSDMTRMVFTAKPTKKQAEIYNLVLKAQLAGLKAIKAGITGKKADQITRSIIEKAGYGENYGHSGGHGIGLDIHETPSLAESYTEKLKENSIITVEPGIYLPGEFGVRIEDMVLVTKTGNKNLTKISKKLI